MPLVQKEMRGHVALVTISRPEALNALNGAMLDALSEAFTALAQDDAVRAVVLTGEGKAFVAGADIAEMKDLTPHEALAYAHRGNALFMAIENLPQPVIAAVNGYALGGGCELALACDIRIASERARFGQPEVGLGVIPGFGGTQRLARAVGPGMAMQMILTGKPIDAVEALRIGLVNAIHAPEALADAAMEMAQAIAGNAPLAVRSAKQAMRAGLDNHLEKHLTNEAKLFGLCFETEDQRNAMAAFVKKRKPEAFTGR